MPWGGYFPTSCKESHTLSYRLQQGCSSVEITLWYIRGKELDVIIFIVLIVTWHSYQNTIKGTAPRLNFWNAVPFFDYGEAIIDSQNFSLNFNYTGSKCYYTFVLLYCQNQNYVNIDNFLLISLCIFRFTNILTYLKIKYIILHIYSLTLYLEFNNNIFKHLDVNI